MDCIGAPGNKRRRKVGLRTVERYAELLRVHVMPALGKRPLQQLQASEIDTLYSALAGKVSPRTAHHVHSVLGACLGTAARTGKIARSPMLSLAKVPSPDEAIMAWRWKQISFARWSRVSKTRRCS